MNEDVATSPEALACTLESTAPDRVPAGRELAATVRASCDPARDLRGANLEIRDGGGEVVAEIELTDFDGEATESAEIALPAPIEPGDYVWTVVLPRQELDGAVLDEATAPLPFTVAPHVVPVVVWGVPAALPAGERFEVRVGIKCAAGCDPSGWWFDIHDHRGETVASGAVGDETWPGTARLHVAEVMLAAPTEEGTFRWEARARSEQRDDLPHDAGTRAFSFTTSAPPEHTVTVRVTDRAKGEPLAGMTVILHPFRTRTGEDGKAELTVPQGTYQLHVSGRRYHPYRAPVEVDDDVAVTAELEFEVRREKISG